MKKTSPSLRRMTAVTTLGVVFAAASSVGSAAMAQPMAGTERVANVLQLSAQGSVSVPQDWMTVTLSASRDGKDAATVQSQLQKVVEAAMTSLRRDAQAGQMEVSTGNFSISPRYSNNGKVDGWQGNAEIILQGRDFTRITQAAANVQDMTMAGLGFGLSREAREKVEGDAQAKAIESFRQKATSISKNFGFSSYSLRNVTVSRSGAESRSRPFPQMMAASKMSNAGSAPVTVEADKAEVTVTVQGSVQMQ